MREAVYDVLEAQRVDFSRVLDLYAGSGALGIEALSRGADWCDFVEKVPAHASIIQENLKLTGLGDHARVWRIAAERAVERLSGPYSLVLADPPYNDDTALRAIEQLAASPLVSDSTTLVLEHSERRKPPETIGQLHLSWSRRYGDTHVSIYRG